MTLRNSELIVASLVLGLLWQSVHYYQMRETAVHWATVVTKCATYGSVQLEYDLHLHCQLKDIQR